MKFRMILLSATISISCLAQSNPGSRITGLGGSASIKDVWNIAANPAGITSFKKPSISISHSRHAFSSEVSQSALALIIPFKNSFTGLSISQYGNSNYNETALNIAFSKKLGDLSLSVGSELFHLSIEGYGKSIEVAANIGVQYSLNREFDIGLYLRNITGLSLFRSNNLLDFPMISGGFSYHPSDRILLINNFSFSNNSLESNVGFEYKLLNALTIRYGIKLKPFKHQTGISLSLEKLALNLSFINDIHLGITPKIDLSYEF